MSPWNYPFQLTLAPLIGSIAGGNCTIVKPSAYSPNTSAIITKIIENSFEPQYISVIQGGREANQLLLEEKFDYIFFTGGVNVGKLVMKAASKHLTPVTLELGGKSPCIVDKSANIELAARRIVWGKFLNAGQTCVAPDYLLVHRDVKKTLLEGMKKYIREFYGEHPCKNDEFPKIINEKHFKRIKEYLSCGKIVVGGDSDEKSLRIAPMILDKISWEDSIMKEEIFGPILPVLEFSDIGEVISTVNGHPKPLAIYLFTTDKKTENKVVRSVSFGGGCINDTIVRHGRRLHRHRPRQHLHLDAFRAGRPPPEPP
jgi:aldehyde dehydrogenase (NAD+)